MAEVFKRLTARGVGTSRVRIGGYTVPAATTAIVIGTSIANVTGDAAEVDFEHHDGTNYTALIKALSLGAGQTLAPAGEVNKIVLQAGDGLFVKSSTAASLDAVISILEIS